MQQILIYFICRLSILEYNEDEQCTLRKEIVYETNIRDFREFCQNPEIKSSRKIRR